jgi:hypothetical protein
MVKSYLTRIIARHRDVMLQESAGMRDFMKLLMKQRNTDSKWTKAEIHEIKAHLKHLSIYVPIMLFFILPFGSLLLPVLAEVLDRRRSVRRRSDALPLCDPSLIQSQGSRINPP